MTDPDKKIEIRTFATFGEIEALPGFLHDNPITQENYERIRGDYWFPEEVHCCYSKGPGSLCREGHKWGFVAELKDETVTILGNNCARSKFGADSKLRSDRAKYLNEKRRREALSSLSESLAERESALKALARVMEHLSQLHTRIADIKARLPDQTLRRLEDMARTGESAVSIVVVNYRDYIDEDGISRRERSAAPARLGSLRGLNCFAEATYRTIQKEAREVERAYDTAESLSEDAKLSVIEALSGAMTNTRSISAQVEQLLKSEQDFLSGDLGLLCFLTPDKNERYKAARLMLELTGQDAGKDKAKDWLANREKELRDSFGAERLEVQ